MSPLLFIILLSLVLILMLFFVLNSQNKREENNNDIPNFDFETAEELSPEEVSLADLETSFEDSKIILYNQKPGMMYTRWHISDTEWDKVINKSQNIGLNNLILRVYKVDGIVKSFDITVNSTYGSQEIDCTPGTIYYCALGIRKSDDFQPLIISNTIISMREKKH